MNIKRIGFFGWRGLVGSILLNNFKMYEVLNKPFVYFSENYNFVDFNRVFHVSDFDNILKCDILIFCSDSCLVKKIFYYLYYSYWKGYIIDASSFLRKKDYSFIFLDTINKDKVLEYLKKGIRFFSGGNCTVNIMLMALGGILNRRYIKSITCSTYQSISGAGINSFFELLDSSYFFLNNVKKISNFGINSIFRRFYRYKFIYRDIFYSLIPWIGGGDKISSEEEDKGEFEVNKILCVYYNKINVYSTCIRVNSIRCHSLSLLITLDSPISLTYIKRVLSTYHSDLILLNNSFRDTLNFADPIKISGNGFIVISRIKKVSKNKFSIFVIADQLLWGTVYPMLKFLLLLVEYIEYN